MADEKQKKSFEETGAEKKSPGREKAEAKKAPAKKADGKKGAEKGKTGCREKTGRRQKNCREKKGEKKPAGEKKRRRKNTSRSSSGPVPATCGSRRARARLIADQVTRPAHRPGAGAAPVLAARLAHDIGKLIGVGRLQCGKQPRPGRRRDAGRGDHRRRRADAEAFPATGAQARPLQSTSEPATSRWLLARKRTRDARLPSPARLDVAPGASHLSSSSGSPLVPPKAPPFVLRPARPVAPPGTLGWKGGHLDMGQKIHPGGFRVGYIHDWKSGEFDEKNFRGHPLRGSEDPRPHRRQSSPTPGSPTS